MIAVWGMGSPSGWRNSATTANQSARPPTIDASAVACTYPSHESPSAPATTVATNTAVTAPRSIVARRLVVTSRRCLRSSDEVGGSMGGSEAVGATLRLVYPPPYDQSSRMAYRPGRASAWSLLGRIGGGGLPTSQRRRRQGGE